jgi:hypothetical protein
MGDQAESLWGRKIKRLLKHEIVSCEATDAQSGIINTRENVISSSPSAASSKASSSVEDQTGSMFYYSLFCCTLVACTWMSAVIGPLYLGYLILNASWASVLSMLTAWLLIGFIKFPRVPLLVDAIAYGIKLWFKPFDLHYEPTSAGSIGQVRRTIYCYHPHGLVSAGATLLAIDLIRRGEPVTVIASGHMRWLNRILKVMMDLAGIDMIGSSRREVKRALQKGDRSFILVPGGYNEAVLTKNGRERLYIRRRYGFIKYAMRYGYTLTPVYAHGETDLYTTVEGAEGIRQALARWNFPVVLFRGNSILPFIPLRVPLRVVVGEAVDVGHHSRHITKDQLHEAHDKYLRRLAELYYQGSLANRPLEIF